MEEKEPITSNGEGVCEKLFNVISCHCSHNHAPPKALSASAAKADSSPLPPPLATKENMKQTTRIIPIEGRSEVDKGVAKLDSAPPQVSVKGQQKLYNELPIVKVEIQRVTSAKGEREKKGGLNINDRASDYIARAKLRIMSTTSFQGGSVTSFK